jgi:hypothetical protein
MGLFLFLDFVLSFLPLMWLSLESITIEREKSVTIVALPLHRHKSSDHLSAPPFSLPFRRSPYRDLTWMPASHPGIFADTIRLHHWFVLLLFQAPPHFVTMPCLLYTVVCSGLWHAFHVLYPWMVRLRQSVFALEWIVIFNLLCPDDIWTNIISLHTIIVAVIRQMRVGYEFGLWVFCVFTDWMRRGQSLARISRMHMSRIVRLLFQQNTRRCQALFIQLTIHTRSNQVLSLQTLLMVSFLVGTTFEITHLSDQTTIDFTTVFKTQSPIMSRPSPRIPENVRLALQTFDGCQLIGNRFPSAFLGTLTTSEDQNKSQTTASRTELQLAAARQGLQALNRAPFNCIRIICDSGASLSCIGNKQEFVTLTEQQTPTELKGIASGLDIHGEGVVRYNVRDDTGQNIELEAKAYWVPQLESMRLLAPQSLRTVQGNVVTVIRHGTLPHGEPSFAEIQVQNKGTDWHSSAPLQRLTIPYDPHSNLPELKGSLPANEETQVMALSGILQVTDEANRNLTGAQKELLKWHYQLGHVGFQWLQWLIRSGRITVSNKNSLSKCPPPKCAACAYGKAMRRATEATTISPKSEKEMELKQGDLIPGQRISVDHYQSAVPGRLYSSRGSTTASNKFHGGAIFVDHASGRVSLVHQVSLSGSDTVKSKLHFEREADESGVVVQSYHTDNGVFTSEQFLTDLLQNQQTI